MRSQAHICRSYGACDFCEWRFYKDVAPLALDGVRASAGISPLQRAMHHDVWISGDASDSRKMKRRKRRAPVVGRVSPLRAGRPQTKDDAHGLSRRRSNVPPPHEPLGTSNIQHPTSNRQSMAQLETIGCSILEVGCWMFSFGSEVQCAKFSGNSLPSPLLHPTRRARAPSRQVEERESLRLRLCRAVFFCGFAACLSVEFWRSISGPPPSNSP